MIAGASASAIQDHLKALQRIFVAGCIPISYREPPHTLHPMKDFDPSEPAILHDRLSDTIIAWSGEGAAAFRRSCVQPVVPACSKTMEVLHGTALYLTDGETC